MFGSFSAPLKVMQQNIYPSHINQTSYNVSIISCVIVGREINSVTWRKNNKSISHMYDSLYMTEDTLLYGYYEFGKKNAVNSTLKVLVSDTSCEGFGHLKASVDGYYSCYGEGIAAGGKSVIISMPQYINITCM